MREPDIFIDQYHFPETIDEARCDIFSRKVLELYGVVQPFFDPACDRILEQMLFVHKQRDILVAHEDIDEDMYEYTGKTKDPVKGFISSSRHGDEEYVQHLVVDRRYQYRGIGSSLLSIVENRAKDDGLERVLLKSSTLAVPFYETRGYELVDEHENTMVLPLSS